MSQSRVPGRQFCAKASTASKPSGTLRKTTVRKFMCCGAPRGDIGAFRTGVIGEKPYEYVLEGENPGAGTSMLRGSPTLGGPRLLTGSHRGATHDEDRC